MAIEAGDAIWRITGDDGPLRSVMSKASIAVGGSITAMGAAITAFATDSIFNFANTGDAIQKMSDRTGFSVERISELKYAAEQSGTSMETLEKAAKKMATTIYEAGEESKAAGVKQAEANAKGEASIIQASGAYTDALAAIGLSYNDLAALSPEDQFMRMALALADVGDATSRAAIAQQLFGRAGTELLPMLAGGAAGISELTSMAHQLGLVFDTEATAKAVTFGDRLDDLKQSFSAFQYDVAVVVIPILIDLMEWVRAAMIQFSAWRDSNPGLVDAIVKVTLAAGAIMTVLGPIIIALPGLIAAWGAVSGAMAAGGVVMVALTGPIGIVLGAIALLAAAAWYFVDDWGAVWDAIVDTARGAAEILVWALQPIFDLIGWILDGLGLINRSNVGGGVPVGLATGGTIQQGGWAMVGERGPELVQLPRGATVFDAGQTAAAGTGGTSLTINFGRDSVRSDEDISMIERAISRIVTTKLQTAGVRI